MNRKEIEEMFFNCLAKTFGENNIKNVDELSSAKDVKGWDSFGHIALLSNLEKKFQIHFSFKDIYSFECIGDIIDLIYEKKG